MFQRQNILWLMCIGMLGGVLLTNCPAVTANNAENATAAPSPSPTLGKFVTFTPAPLASCPQLVTHTHLGLPPDILVSKSQDLGAAAIAAYLNAGGSVDELSATLKKTYSDQAQLFLTDVTGDGVPDIVVNIAFDDFREGALVVYRCADGKYLSEVIEEPAAQLTTEVKPKSTAHIVTIQDMNADGLAEIVYTYIPNVGTGGGDTFLDIYEWNGRQFVLLDAPVPPDPRSEPPPDKDHGIRGREPVTIREHGNGTFEVSLVKYAGKNAMEGGNITGRDSEIIWAWNGQAFTQFCSRAIEPATYRVQAVVDGDDESNCRHYDKAMKAYQRAIFDTNLQSWITAFSIYDTPPPTPLPDLTERAILSAYARYRIVVLHAVQNQITEAATDNDVLQKLFPEGSPGHEYAKLATVFWAGFGDLHNVTKACHAAIAYADTNPEIISPLNAYAYDSMGIDGAGPAIPAAADTSQICPF